MKTIKEILAALEASQARMEDLFGKAQAEKDETKRGQLLGALEIEKGAFKALSDELTVAKGKVATQQIINEARQLAAAETTPALNLNPEGQPGDPQGKVTTSIIKDAAKDEALKMDAFLNYLSGKSLKDEELNRISAHAPEYRNRFAEAGKEAVVIPRRIISAMLNPDPAYAGKVILSTDATGATTDSNAIKLLAPEYKAQLIREPVFMPQMIDLVSVETTKTGKFSQPMLDQDSGRNFGGVAFTWKATEGADKLETTPYFKDFEVETHEISGWTELSTIMLTRSAIQLEALITSLFRESARYQLSLAILRGAGTASHQPIGIVGHAGIKTVARAEANKVLHVDLVNLLYGLTKGNRMNGGIFILDDTAEKYLAGQKDADGRPIFMPSTAEGMRDRLIGYNYITHEHGPALGTAGDVLFGNPQRYVLVINEDIAIDRSDHAEFKKGRVVFRMMMFVGGKLRIPGAISQLSNPA